MLIFTGKPKFSVMKLILNLTLILNLIIYSISAREYQISSPDGKIKTTVAIGKEICYSVQFNNEKVLNSSSISFAFEQAPPLGKDMEIVSDKTFSVDETWKPVLKRFETIRNNYNGLKLELKEIKFPQRKLTLEFRVFDNGMAFRTEFPEQFAHGKTLLWMS